MRLPISEDVIRLLQLLPEDLRLTLPESIRIHVGQFISSISYDVVNMDALGVSMSKEDAIDLLKSVYSPL